MQALRISQQLPQINLEQWMLIITFLWDVKSNANHVFRTRITTFGANGSIRRQRTKVDTVFYAMAYTGLYLSPVLSSWQSCFFFLFSFFLQSYPRQLSIQSTDSVYVFVRRSTYISYIWLSLSVCPSVCLPVCLYNILLLQSELQRQCKMLC